MILFKLELQNNNGHKKSIGSNTAGNEQLIRFIRRMVLMCGFLWKDDETIPLALFVAA